MFEEDTVDAEAAVPLLPVQALESKQSRKFLSIIFSILILFLSGMAFFSYENWEQHDHSLNLVDLASRLNIISPKTTSSKTQVPPSNRPKSQTSELSVPSQKPTDKIVNILHPLTDYFTPTNEPISNPTNRPGKTYHPTKEPRPVHEYFQPLTDLFKEITKHMTDAPSVVPTLAPTVAVESNVLPTIHPTGDSLIDPLEEALKSSAPAAFPTTKPSHQGEKNPTVFPTFDVLQPPEDLLKHEFSDMWTPTLSPARVPSVTNEPTHNPAHRHHHPGPDERMWDKFINFFTPTLQPINRPTRSPDQINLGHDDFWTNPHKFETDDFLHLNGHHTHDDFFQDFTEIFTGFSRNPVPLPTMEPTWDYKKIIRPVTNLFTPTEKPSNYPTLQPTVVGYISPTIHPTGDSVSQKIEEVVATSFSPVSYPTYSPTQQNAPEPTPIPHFLQPLEDLVIENDSSPKPTKYPTVVPQN